MKAISLTVDELIYCFYSEGLFENGIALKQTFFGDMSDECLEVVFQAACRSLLSKDYISYENHKFKVKEKIAKIISSLHYSESSLKISKFVDSENQETTSIHIGENGMIQHTLLYDSQIHTFSIIGEDKVQSIVGEYLNVTTHDVQEESILTFTEEEFDEMLNIVDRDPQSLYGFLQRFGKDMRYIAAFSTDVCKNKGFMNSIVVFEFNEKREPVVKNAYFFVEGSENTWIITKNNVDQKFEVRECNQNVIGTYVKKDMDMYKRNVVQSK